jgi:hypothetical protein
VFLQRVDQDGVMRYDATTATNAIEACYGRACKPRNLGGAVQFVFYGLASANWRSSVSLRLSGNPRTP